MRTPLEIEGDPTQAPYRSPEAVIEPLEELPPGHIPGIVAEHFMSDDEMASIDSSPILKKGEKEAVNVDVWQANLQHYNMDNLMDVDDPVVSAERPQVGPGILPGRWLEGVHEHDLFQPVIGDLPVRPPSTAHVRTSSSSNESPIASKPTGSVDKSANLGSSSPTPSVKIHTSEPSLPDYEHVHTLADVLDACPGGEDGLEDWFFCPTCWGWFRVMVIRGVLPHVETMEDWEIGARLQKSNPNFEEIFGRARDERLREWSRLNDIKTSKMMAEETHDHLHLFTTLREPSPEDRIDRVPVETETNAFPHLAIGGGSDVSQSVSSAKRERPRLYVSCSSNLWLLVDTEPLPGQLPVALVKSFAREKMDNPGPGLDGPHSVYEAWNLIATSAVRSDLALIADLSDQSFSESTVQGTKRMGQTR